MWADMDSDNWSENIHDTAYNGGVPAEFRMGRIRN